ncbi:MAG: hypothetical protein HY791_38165 [Deltaproteobacteria bacterium]|nr:hypothetical protein [Deltaproteobacteria bacterium]
MSCADARVLALLLIACEPQAAVTLTLGLERTPSDVASISVFVTEVAEQRIVASATVGAQRVAEPIMLGVPAETLLEIAAVARTSTGVPSWVAYREERVPLRREPSAVELTLRPAGVLIVDTTELDDEVSLEPEHHRERGWLLAPELIHERVVEQGRWSARSRRELDGGRGLWVERRGASRTKLQKAPRGRPQQLVLGVKDGQGLDTRAIGPREPFFIDVAASRPRDAQVRWRFSEVAIAPGGSVTAPATLGPFQHDGSARFIAVDEEAGDSVSVLVGRTSQATPHRVALTLLDPERLGLGTWLAVDVLDERGWPLETAGSVDLGDSDPHVYGPDGVQVMLGPQGALVRVVRGTEPLDRAAVLRARVDVAGIALFGELELPRIH